MNQKHLLKNSKARKLYQSQILSILTNKLRLLKYNKLLVLSHLSQR